MNQSPPLNPGQQTSYPTLPLRGRSGATYLFTVFPWGTSFKQLGGVYVVLRREQLDQYTVLYVGQTEDLRTRFDNHHKQGCFDRNRKTHIGVLLESSEQRRLAIEADPIAAYRPTCND